MAQVHLLVPQLPWMSRTAYTACLRPARNLNTTTLTGKITCKECRRIRKGTLKDGEHPLYHFFHQKRLKGRPIDAPYMVWEYMRKNTFQSREAMYAIYANTKRHVIESSLLSVGTIRETVLIPAMVFKPAIELCATYVYLVHNHPTGCSLPSDTDFKVTEKLIEAGEIMSIELSDHIVCTPGEYTSMRESYPHMFPR